MSDAIEISSAGINRMARRAGVVMLSTECYDISRNLIENKLKEILNIALVYRKNQKNSILSEEHIHMALNSLGHRVATTEHLGGTLSV